MLEQKRVIEISECIEHEESKIVSDQPVYLITWCPDPKELPDADFYLQHNVNAQLLIDYLMQCRCGIFCVESTQIGNPHYHGWYQVRDSSELARVAIIKTMQRFGIVKIAKAKKIKRFCWSENANALYYYKKDCLDACLNVTPNPITSASFVTVNFDVMDLVGFFSKDKSCKTIKDKVSDRKFYRDFYSDTISTLK